MPVHRVVAASVLAVFLFTLGRAQSAVAVGSHAPAFKLAGDVGAPPSSGAATLIAFIDFAAPVTDAALSKSQVDVVREIASAHPGAEFRSVLVDASATVNGRSTSLVLLESRIREWSLEKIPVVQDHDGAGLARRYGVSIVPCVFVVDGDGIVRGRWDGFIGGREIEQTISAIRAARPGIGGDQPRAAAPSAPSPPESPDRTPAGRSGGS